MESPQEVSVIKPNLGMRASLLTGTALTKPDATFHKINAENLIMAAGDIVRWLYYKEFNMDPGPLTQALHQQMSLRYRTRLWGRGNKELQRNLRS